MSLFKSFTSRANVEIWIRARDICSIAFIEKNLTEISVKGIPEAYLVIESLDEVLDKVDPDSDDEEEES